jgi:type IX secretion system PorP/SprF family membrane protein
MSVLQAQHSNIYSQYYFSGILINPAYAGSQGALNFTGIYRNQWSGMEGAPQNISIGLHTPLKNEKNNLGLVFLNSTYGLSTENKLAATYAYRMKLGTGKLSFGMQAGIGTLRNRWSQVQTIQAEDPVFNQAAEKQTAAEFGAGAFYNNNRLFLGLSSPTIYATRPGYDISSGPLLLSAGYVFALNNDIKLKPSMLLKYLENSPAEADLTATLFLKDLIAIGAGYRTQDALYAYFDLRVNEQFHFGYSYDYTISKLKNYSNGSHELMLRYLFYYKLNSRNPRYF